MIKISRSHIMAGFAETKIIKCEGLYFIADMNCK